MDMQTIINELAITGGTFLKRIVTAVLIFVVGRAVINWIVKRMENSRGLGKIEGTARTFVQSLVRIVLWGILVIAVVGALGVEMTSIAALLTSAGVAVGLALQGALSNLAGGIMLMIFKPFRLGDYVDAAGARGVVTNVTLFYTVILTDDNKRVTVPNGALMNTNVTDFSAEKHRRVDLTFTCGRGESVSRVREVLLAAANDCPLAVTDPQPPFAGITGATNEAVEFTVRVWCNSADYWTTYFDLNQRVSEALAAAGVAGPSVRIETK